MFQNDFTLTQHNFISLTVLEVTLPFQKKQRSTHFTSRLSKASTLFQKLIGNLSHPKVLTKNDNLLPYYFGDVSGKVIKEKEKRLTSFIPNNNWTTASQKTVFQLRASHLFFPAILLLKKHQKKFQWSLYKCFLFFFHLAIDLIKKLLTTDPQKRITVDGALQHPWISVSICPWTRTVYIPTWLLVLGVFFPLQCMCVHDQEWGQDDWILSVFFFCVLMDRDKSRSIKRKKWTRLISSHLDRTSLVNEGFILW